MCSRYILVHHGFGLVIKGSSNLNYFNILYWLLNTFLVLFIFLSMPLAKVVDFTSQFKVKGMVRSMRSSPGTFFIMMENITLILIQRFSADLSPRTTFMIYYGFLAALIHFYHGLWLPVRYLIISRDQYYVLWAERRQDKETEEVQSVRVEPRRDYLGEGRRGVGSSVTRFSYSRREPLSHTRLDFVSIEI